jgi:CheY-like chemotaxis protein/HPt (histidine-containing phosphotransfer) domain-containing protein
MCLQIDIVDTGIGISDEAKRQLFLKFSQADQSITRRFGGTGLGLAIAKELIEAMGGEVGVESRAGEGSRFWFTVPLRPAAAGRAADTVSAVEPSIDAPANGAGKRILLAEDVHINQIIATELLQSVGYVVDIAQNGEEAVQAAQAGGYDLVLMDVHMPLVDGLEATRRIRALDGPVSRIPIVALTADAVAGVRERYLAAGMDDFLSKPFEPATLFAMVERWTEDAGTAPVGVEERSAIAHDQLASVRNLMSEAKFTEFVSGCIAATRDRVGRMSRQAAGADLVDLAKEAHSLIGTAGAIGGTRLIVLARRLEDVCKAGGTVEARQLVAELSAEADDACTELERRFKAA